MPSSYPRKSLLTIAALMMVVIFLTTSAAQAQLQGQLGILDLNANGGINPATGSPWQAGDQYRFIFASSTGSNALSTNITDYNNFIQGLANASPLGLGSVTWRALGSTQTVDARDNTNTNINVNGPGESFWLLNGTSLVADNYTDLYGFATHSSPINVSETGGAPYDGGDFTSVWTGSTAAGQAFADNWLGGVPNSLTGLFNHTTGSHWIQRFSIASAQIKGLYGLSEPLTVLDPATGVPLYWDTNGATSGTNASSTGNWTDSSWTLNALGETATRIWASGADAVFSAGTSGTGVQQITVSGLQSAQSLTVEEGTVVFIDGGSGQIDINGGAGAATVAAGATLGGNVALGGNLSGAGDIAPGLSAGAITVGGSFDMNGTYRWELGAPLDDTTGTAGVDWDLINTGSADLSALTLDLDFIDSATDPDSGDSFWASDHTWLIVDSGAPITGDFLGITFDAAAADFEAGSFDTSIDGNQAFLQFTAGGTGGPGGSSGAVPEPASIAIWSLLALGLVGYGAHRARRKT